MSTTEVKGWNPRYLAYCRTHGHSPEAQLEADRSPGGGSMVPFMLWIDEQWRAWGKEHGVHPQGAEAGLATRDGSFDLWLDARCPA